MCRYGFLALFADFIPTALMFLKKVPGLSTVLDMAVVKNVRLSVFLMKRNNTHGCNPSGEESCFHALRIAMEMYRRIDSCLR